MACPSLKGFHQVNACLTGASDRPEEECAIRVGEFWNSMLKDPTCDPNILTPKVIDKSQALLEKSKLGRWLYWEEIKELKKMASESLESIVNE